MMADGADPTRPDLSIVFPVYNEQERLPATLRTTLEYLAGGPATWEIVVSDDGSRDGTAEMVARDFPQCRVLTGYPNMGKGAAVRRGMLQARGALRLFSDADLSTPIDELAGMCAALEQGGYDVVIASRAVRGAQLEVHQPWWRELSGRAFNAIVRPFSGLPFADTQCGFKLFTAAAAERLFAHQHSDGWAFDVELLMLARFFGLRVLEHPVRWINNEESKINMLRDAPRMLGDVMRFRWRSLTGGMAAPNPVAHGGPPAVSSAASEESP